MQTQTSSTAAYVDMLNMQAEIFSNAFDGINDADALIRPNNLVNHVNWLLGHLTTCRFMLLSLIGGNANDPYFNIYFRSISDEHKYRSLKEIKESWGKVSKLLIEKIESISEEELETEINGKGGSPKDFISFFTYHEAYHLGQAGYARKFLGLPALRFS